MINLVFILLYILFSFFFFNFLLKQTNWWKNIFVFTKQFEKRKEKYDIVNLGSNPARFAFSYDCINGENWSTGTQGLNMDHIILEEFGHQIKPGGVVIIPLVIFSSVSEYLNQKSGWRDVSYYLKYARILSKESLFQIFDSNIIWMHYKFPLVYYGRNLKYIIKDVEKYEILTGCHNSVSPEVLENTARSLIKGWMSEFDIKDLRAPLEEKLITAQKESAQYLMNIIKYARNHDLRPVIVFPPMSEVLSKLIPDETIKFYVYDFIAMMKLYDVPFLDYSKSLELQSPNLYFNALFMNQKGRKVFTARVLSDLKFER